MAFPGQAKQQSHWVLGELLHSGGSTFAGCVALDMDSIPTGQGCRVDNDVLRVSGDCRTKVSSCADSHWGGVPSDGRMAQVKAPHLPA